jgi:hypothetical protein
MCKPPSKTDLITYFDNNQVMARNWKIRFDSKAMFNVITSVMHIKLGTISHFQYQAELDHHVCLVQKQLT